MITTNAYVDVCKVSSNYRCYKVNGPHQTTLPSDINCSSGKVPGITLMFKKKEGVKKKLPKQLVTTEKPTALSLIY